MDDVWSKDFNIGGTIAQRRDGHCGNKLGKLGFPTTCLLDFALAIERQPDNINVTAAVVITRARCYATEAASVPLSEVLSEHLPDAAYPAAPNPALRSNFPSAVLADARLLVLHHGVVYLVRDWGPMLLYQISARDTRMLVNLRSPQTPRPTSVPTPSRSCPPRCPPP
jgi:hypothetical protein